MNISKLDGVNFLLPSEVMHLLNRNLYTGQIGTDFFPSRSRLSTFAWWGKKQHKHLDWTPLLSYTMFRNDYSICCFAQLCGCSESSFFSPYEQHPGTAVLYEHGHCPGSWQNVVGKGKTDLVSTQLWGLQASIWWVLLGSSLYSLSISLLTNLLVLFPARFILQDLTVMRLQFQTAHAV